MSFGDHIEELRTRMIRAILGFLVALVVGLVVGQPVLDFIQAPVKCQLEKFYDARIATLQKQVDTDMASRPADQPLDPKTSKVWLVQIQETGVEGAQWKLVKLMIDPNQVAVSTDQAARQITRPSSLTTLTITEAFMTYFLVSIYCGIVLTSPWIFWQLWQFIAAGLYPA